MLDAFYPSLVNQILQIFFGVKAAGIFLFVFQTAVLIIFRRVDSFQTDPHVFHFQTVAVHHRDVYRRGRSARIQASGQQTTKQFACSFPAGLRLAFIIKATVLLCKH